MKYMTTAEIREAYLSFFEKKGCKRMPSSSLIPDDPSLLLTSAGMVQFKPYFLQQKHLDDAYIGATTSQKCVRTNDIDIIGTTGRHLSFFEMLGNFAFGKYFKNEMCAWALEFCLDVLELPKEKLYFTVFEDDDETFAKWLELGVEESHISRLGEDDNFWRAGPTGPCGPCSEIYFDKGEECGCGSPDCKPGCDCDRYVEFWNCVFTQFDAQEDGSMPELPFKNIDTGMGLERIAAIMQGVSSNYDTDILRSLVGVGERLSGYEYGKDDKVDLALRIMADHSRAVTFMIADGILPSNEGRGYVLRRLLRRAIMKGNLIGIQGEFVNEFVDEIERLMGDVYPEIVENRELIRRLISSEEQRFGATLHQGKAFLTDELANLKGNVLSGKVAFKLHDTYGFPLEVTTDICGEKGIEVDIDEFNTEMEAQRERARHAGESDAEAAWSTYGGVFSKLLDEHGKTQFVGYSDLETIGNVVALVRKGELIDAAYEGEEVDVVLDKTSMYAEMGGQVGDVGTISSDKVSIEVNDVTAPEAGLHAHHCKILSGTIEVGDEVIVRVQARHRHLTERNHTATHILHAALRQVLGDHVKQAGSYVGPDRLRFDFTHFEKMTPEQIQKVEEIANNVIMHGISSNIFETSLDEARKAGVTALFGEKYGDVVRVVQISDFSRELCGGCHVKNTAEIGLIKIISESSVGANMRRIEAVTSAGAIEYVNKIVAELKETADLLKVPMFDVSERTAANIKAARQFDKVAKASEEVIAEDRMSQILDEAVTAKGGYPVVVVNVRRTLNASIVRNLWDIIRAKMKEPGACVLAGKTEDNKPIIMAAGTKEAVEKGFNAADVIRAAGPAIKGGGGGKPEMAQAGGKNADGIEDAIKAMKEVL
ncbi:MAG: alanine--tRNA ligase [Phoenicibacter congonensis]|uniref:Alanine--tRNA ligase n=1 Tax=Phoenicibacter congonensis TaxID=1944646 RepID=A0AA43U8J2_9ACTN|nr:alanine--tRNA ligase [Phoenicibacter congonensis]